MFFARSRRRWRPAAILLVALLAVLPLAAGLDRVVAQDEGTPVPAVETGDEVDPAGTESQDLVPVETSRVAHIHADPCDDLGIVVYSLAGLRSYQTAPAGAGDGQALEMIAGTANVELTDLFGEPFSIHIHESAANKQIYLACAEVGTEPPAPWSPLDGLTLRLREQADSGFAGFASLLPAADGGTSVTLFISPTAVDAQAEQSEEGQGEEEPEAAPTPPPLTTYVSPTFGYSLAYNPTWEETQNPTGEDRDLLVLTNGTSFVTVTGTADFGGDTQSCVEDSVAVRLEGDPNASNLQLATDENGDPIQGGTEATGAFAVYTHDYTFPDRVESYTFFVGCIPLPSGEEVIAFVQNVPTAEYNDQVDDRDVLLRGLVLPQ